MIDAALGPWDLFISHASEDKADFVAPLANALSRFGVNVWYDEYTLSLGDSLSRSIDQGLAKSDYGLVVLSPAFFAKRWPEYELRGLTSREMAGKKVILPIWHKVSFDDILAFSPPLADKLAIKSDSESPIQIAAKIVRVVRPDIFTRIQSRMAYKSMDFQRTTVSVKDMRTGPARHDNLPDDLIGRIRLIRATLLGVYPHSMDFWVGGFERDAHPSREVAIWEHVSAVYREYIVYCALNGKQLSAQEHRAAFSYVSLLSIGIKEITTNMLGQLPKKEFQIIEELYRSSMPLFDFDEDWPSAEGGDAVDPPTALDLEAFPYDLPEDLIAELLRLEGKTSKGSTR